MAAWYSGGDGSTRTLRIRRGPDLCQLVQIVSFKWLARDYGISATAAKQHLQTFAKQHSKTVRVTYLLAGLTPEDPPRHVVQLVNQGQLKERRAALDSETSLHIYSVQPAQIKVHKRCQLLGRAPDRHHPQLDIRMLL